MSFESLISKMITFIALMLVGYILARKKVLDKAFSRGLSFLVLNVFLTCTVLNSVIANRPQLSGAELLHIIGILTLSTAIAYIVSALAVRVLRVKDDNAPIYELLISVVNSMFVGMPLIDSLYGSVAVLYCALSCIPFNVLLYTYGVWRLKSGKNISGGIHLKDVFTVPLIATIVALIIFAFDISLPTFLVELIGTTAAATTPTSMVVIGVTLGGISLTEAFKEKRVYIISFVRLVLIPAITWLVVSKLTSDSLLISTATILAACPSAVVVTVLALQHDYDPVFSSKGVLVTTLLSMLTLPVWALILA